MTTTSNPDANALEALRLLGPDPDNWVPDRAGIDHNVLIVGGGQTGAAFAFALRRAGIGKVSVIDAAADEAGAGVWLNRARMNKLRTPKTLTGPELSVAGLSFQAWFEARWGAAAYADIDRIPRARWAEYLGWYRHFLKVPVRYATRLARIEPVDSHFRDRKSTRLNSSHLGISYAVFCLKKKKNSNHRNINTKPHEQKQLKTIKNKRR